MNDRGEDRTDWERVDALTEEELEASIDLRGGGLSRSGHGSRRHSDLSKKQITLRLDPDVIEWFKAQGPGYQTRMNAVLRSYMLAKAK